MPWCPKCRNEYQEGFTVCADCGADLVEELPEEVEYEPVAFISEESLAEKLVEYLGYSSIEAEIEYSEEEKAYGVYVEVSKMEQAKTAFIAFYRIESKTLFMKDVEDAAEQFRAEKAEKALESFMGVDESLLESIPDTELSREEKDAITKAVIAERVYKPAEVYINKTDESKDMFATSLTFLGFAVALFILFLLSLLNIVTIFSSWPSLTMLAFLSIGCCAVGINAIQRSRRAEIAAVAENKLTDDVKEWLDKNITEEMFKGISEEELGKEIVFLRRSDVIRAALMAEFPDLEEGFAEEMIEEFYTGFFEGGDTAEEVEEDSKNNEADE